MNTNMSNLMSVSPEPDDRVKYLVRGASLRRIEGPWEGRYAEIRHNIEKYRKCVTQLSPEDQAGKYRKAIEGLKRQLIDDGETAAACTAVEGFDDIGIGDIFPDTQSRELFDAALADAFFEKKSYDAFLDAVEDLCGIVRQRYAMRYAACLTQTFYGRPYLPVPGLYWSGYNRCWYKYSETGEWVPDYRFPPLDVVEALSKNPKARALLNLELARREQEITDVRQIAVPSGEVPQFGQA